MFGWVKWLVRKQKSAPPARIKLSFRGNPLLLSLGRVLAPIEERQNSRALHQTCGGVAKEFAFRLQSSIDSDMVFRYHVEVARLWWMVGCLFRDVIRASVIREIPVASEDFP